MSTREGVGESDSEASREEPQARAGLTTIRRDVHTVFRSRLADVVPARRYDRTHWMRCLRVHFFCMRLQEQLDSYPGPPLRGPVKEPEPKEVHS